MEQKTRRVVMFIAGSLLSVTGIVVGACSTDNGTTSGGTPGFDAGRDAKTSNPDGSTEPEEDGSTNPGDAGPDCSSAPKVSGKDDNTMYCFGANDGGGCDMSQDDQACCSEARFPDGGFVPPVCIARSTGCFGNPGPFTGSQDGGLQFDCTEASHCATAQRCCVAPGFAGSPQAQQNNDFPGCQAYFNSGNPRFVGGTRCRADCNAGELTLCSKDADCKAGTCKPIKLANRFTGVCIVSGQ